MDYPENNNPSRITPMHGLAAIGFVALIVAGIWLAVYSTRFVPTVVNRVGSAAVYLGSVFSPAPTPSVTVVPTEPLPTIIPFGAASSTVTTTVTTIITPAKVPPKPIVTSAGSQTNNTYQIGTTTAHGTLYGFPDLVVNIAAVGYLSSCASTDSFVASTIVPTGNCPATKFTIKNIGTNATGAWRWNASIPTSSNQIYQSAEQQNLNPGDYIEYTLGFTQAIPGTGKMISVTANYDHAVSESNTNNNSASAYLTILGS